MKFKIIYLIGSIILFLGLFWMLLPHANHAEIISSISSEIEETSHFLHTLEGLTLTILGLIIMIYSNRKINSTTFINPQ